jgi:Domain of unknown function (DUF4440)
VRAAPSDAQRGARQCPLDFSVRPVDSGAVVDVSELVEVLREVERRRLRSLVERDMPVALALHADEYQLITPGGATESKHDYLGGIEAGRLDYHVFQAVSEVAVRAAGDAAILRYQAQIEIAVAGQMDAGLFWHTDYYELRDERWQAVWSQATRINR